MITYQQLFGQLELSGAVWSARAKFPVHRPHFAVRLWVDCWLLTWNETNFLVGAMRLSAEEKCHSRSCISGALCKAVSSFGAHLELWTSERASEEPGHVHPSLLQHQCRCQCDQPPPWRRYVCHLCLQAQLPWEDLEIPSKQANCNSSRLLGVAGDGWDDVEESSFATKRAFPHWICS